MKRRRHKSWVCFRATNAPPPPFHRTPQHKNHRFTQCGRERPEGRTTQDVRSHHLPRLPPPPRQRHPPGPRLVVWQRLLLVKDASHVRLEKLNRLTRDIASRALEHGLSMPSKKVGLAWARDIGAHPALTTYLYVSRSGGWAERGGWRTIVLVWETESGEPLPWLNDLAAEAAAWTPKDNEPASGPFMRVLIRTPLLVLDTAWRLGGRDALLPLVRKACRRGPLPAFEPQATRERRTSPRTPTSTSRP